MIRIASPIVEEDEIAAVADVLRSGMLAQGARVAAFEAAFAAYIGTGHAVAVNSGTAALHVALLARGITAGDEVIVPAFSFAATANTVIHAGATPVFADVREDDFGIDSAQAEAAITPRTKAIVPVHLYGQACDVEAIAAICARHGIALIEDSAQAIGGMVSGRRCGSFGDGAFSFYATKNLQTGGEGGTFVTHDADVADRARLWRSQGERTRYVTEEPGYNYRMTEMAAAIGLLQLSKIDARNEARRANAARLTSLLAGNDAIVLPGELPGRTHAWHQYVIRIRAGREARDQLQAAMRERGIETAVFYPAPIHKQPYYQRAELGAMSLPVAERLANEVLALPVHPALSPDDVDAVAAAVNALTLRTS